MYGVYIHMSIKNVFTVYNVRDLPMEPWPFLMVPGVLSDKSWGPAG